MIGLLAMLFIYILILFAIIQFTLWYRRSRLSLRKPAGVPQGFTRTEEISIDPTTGIRQRVWYNPETGERFYENLPE